MRDSDGKFHVYKEVFTNVEWCYDCEKRREKSFGYDEDNKKVSACTICNKEYYDDWKEK